MKKLREVLRHHQKLKLSNEKTAFCVGVSKGSVYNILDKFRSQNLSYEEIEKLSDQKLFEIFYPKTSRSIRSEERSPDFKALALELSKPDTTIQILYEEYRQENPKGIGRTTFFEGIRAATNKLKVDLHIEHIGGEKLYLDYSGDKLSYFDKELGKEMQAEVFVASWGASSKCYFEVSRSQKKEDWLESNTRALRYFKGAPLYLVPDNLKSAVIKADYWDPTINEAYRKMAEHFGTTVLPARSRKPKDKAVVEANVRAIQQRVFTKMRNETFLSFEELQKRCKELLEVFNEEIMQKHKLSRNDRFEKLDQPFLRPLPKDDFDLYEISLNVKVQSDHHVLYNKHFYSVPWEWTGSKIEVWSRANVIEFYFEGERIASHPKAPSDGKYTTTECHRPPEHQFVSKLKPCFVLSEGAEIGPETLKAFRNIMDAYKGHSENGVRKCMSILRLKKEFGSLRLEKAIARALTLACVKASDLKQMLEQKLEDSPLWGTIKTPIAKDHKITSHDNIRGAKHYNQEKGVANES